MTDTIEERSPRFSRSILIRILAVMAFVCLGTFAVVQSVIGNNENADSVTANESETDPADSLQRESKTDPDSEAKDSTSPTTGLNFSINPSKNGFSAPRPKSFESNEFSKPATPSFAGKNSATNGQSSFESNRRSGAASGPPLATTRPSLKSNSSSGPPIVLTKQATPGMPPPSKSFSGQPLTDQLLTKDPTKQPVSGKTQSTPPPSLRPTTSSSPKTSQPQTNNSFNSQSSGTPKTLGNPSNKAAPLTRDIAGGAAVAGSSLLGAQKRPSNNTNRSQPTTGTARSTTPPNASFDTTQDLKPFGQRPPQNTNSPSSFSGSPAVVPSAPPKTENSNSRTTGGTFNPINTPNRQSAQPPTLQTTRQPTRQPFAQASTQSTLPQSTLPSSSPSNGINPQVINTPGDRQLEGVQAPALTIEKLAPREIQVNQPADFQIVVRNSGRVAANEVVVFDVVPKGTEFISAVPQPNRTGSQGLRWNLGELRPGQEKRIKIRLNPITPGEIGSVAHVTFASQASMRTRVTKPVLEIRHSTRPKVLIGDNVILDVIVENKGDGPANNVLIQEDVPTQLEFSDGTRELEYAVGTLNPGQSKRVRLALRAAEIGRLKNVVIATASGGLKAQHAVDMEVIAPQLVATGEGPKRKFLKRQATYVFSVENKGTADATNVELVARLPGGLQFVSANNRGKYDANSHAVYWSLAELTPKMVGSVEIKTLPIESGEQNINFQATADLNQNSKTIQSLLVEHLIDVFFEIDDVADPIETGSPTSYRIRIVNQGTKAATNVKIDVIFPNGMMPVSVDGNVPGEVRGQQVEFAPITSMSPREELTVVVNAKGTAPGDHRIVVRLQTDGRATPVSKEETTHVYDDR